MSASVITQHACVSPADCENTQRARSEREKHGCVNCNKHNERCKTEAKPSYMIDSNIYNGVDLPAVAKAKLFKTHTLWIHKTKTSQNSFDKQR